MIKQNHEELNAKLLELISKIKVMAKNAEELPEYELYWSMGDILDMIRDFEETSES